MIIRTPQSRRLRRRSDEYCLRAAGLLVAATKVDDPRLLYGRAAQLSRDADVLLCEAKRLERECLETHVRFIREVLT